MEFDSDSEYYSDDSYSEISYPYFSDDDDETYYFYLNETYKKKWYLTMFVCLVIGIYIGKYMV